MEFRSLWKRLKGAVFITRAMLHGSTEFGPIFIYGPEEFRQRATHALKILEQNAPNVLQLLKKYVDIIVWSTESKVNPAKRPAIIFFGRESDARFESIQFAGRLAHEVYHCKLYWD